MKTVSVSENANRQTAPDKAPPKKNNTRKFLQTLQPSGGDKENLVGTGRVDSAKTLKPPVKADVDVKLKDKKSLVAKVNPSLYQKLIVEDLTTTAGPSEKYWEVIAERRRKALEDVLEQNRKLCDYVKALEEENLSCKKLLEHNTDLVNTLKSLLESDDETELDENESEVKDEEGPSTEAKKPDSDSDCSSSETE